MMLECWFRDILFLFSETIISPLMKNQHFPFRKYFSKADLLIFNQASPKF